MSGYRLLKHRWLQSGTVLTWLLLLIIVTGIATPDPSLAQTQCGVERWSVKTGTDPDASSVDVTTSVPTTVAALVALPAPDTLPNNQRIEPVETTVWVVDATLSGYKRESDSDYHLVLSDENGNTMIVEIPSPGCVGVNSPFFDAIGSARASFDAELHATSSFRTANIPVRVTGVGFFDFLHGQTGVAPNGIELHPVLDIVFNPTTETGTIFFVAVNGARVRECPQTSCTVITHLQRGAEIEVLQTVNGTAVQGDRTWYRIQVNGQDAFIHSSVVTTTRPTSTGSSTTGGSSSGGSSGGIQPTSPPISTPVPPPPSQRGVSCGGATTCGQMSSCEQARACLAEGRTSLDRDHDGIPCESICGG